MHLIKLTAGSAVEAQLKYTAQSSDIDWLCVCVDVWNCARALHVSECKRMCVCMVNIFGFVWVCVHVEMSSEWRRQYSSKKAANKQNEWTCANRVTRAIHFLLALTLPFSFPFLSLPACVRACVCMSVVRLLPPHLFFERFVARWSSSSISLFKAITSDFTFVVPNCEANKIYTTRTHTHSSKLDDSVDVRPFYNQQQHIGWRI